MTARTNAGIDQNDVKSLLAVSSADGESIVVVWADPATHALLVKSIGGVPGGGIDPILATDSGDHQNFNLASSPVTSAYLVSVNGGLYFPADPQFGFTVSGLVLTFNTPLDATTASTLIYLICYSGQTGSSVNFVGNEIVSGSGTSWTLANTPTTNSVDLRANGQFLTPGVGNDYTISGENITTANSYSAGTVVAFYRF